MFLLLFFNFFPEDDDEVNGSPDPCWGFARCRGVAEEEHSESVEEVGGLSGVSFSSEVDAMCGGEDPDSVTESVGFVSDMSLPIVLASERQQNNGALE